MIRQNKKIELVIHNLDPSPDLDMNSGFLPEQPYFLLL